MSNPELEKKVKDLIGDPKADLSGYTVEQLQEYIGRATQFSALHVQNTTGLTEEQKKAYDEALIKVKDSPAMNVIEMHEYAKEKLDAYIEANKPADEPPADTPADTPPPDPKVPPSVPPRTEPSAHVIDDANPAPLGNDDDYFKHLFTTWQKQHTIKPKAPINTD